MRIAVTGHRGLPARTERLVEAEIRARLDELRGDGLVGLSCLADGADQIFARALLDAGGDLEVVIPAKRYRDGLPAESQPTYDELLGHAVAVHALERVESDEHAHMDASRTMLEHADRLLAVWDGQPARGYGGTADVVRLARERGIEVDVIWPNGARRD